MPHPLSYFDLIGHIISSNIKILPALQLNITMKSTAKAKRPMSDEMHHNMRAIQNTSPFKFLFSFRKKYYFLQVLWEADMKNCQMYHNSMIGECVNQFWSLRRFSEQRSMQHRSLLFLWAARTSPPWSGCTQSTATSEWTQWFPAWLQSRILSKQTHRLPILLIWWTTATTSDSPLHTAGSRPWRLRFGSRR